jgi:hypothetical protein
VCVFKGLAPLKTYAWVCLLRTDSGLTWNRGLELKEFLMKRAFVFCACTFLASGFSFAQENGGLEAEISSIREEVGVLKSDVGEIARGLVRLQSNVEDLKKEVSSQHEILERISASSLETALAIKEMKQSGADFAMAMSTAAPKSQPNVASNVASNPKSSTSIQASVPAVATASNASRTVFTSNAVPMQTPSYHPQVQYPTTCGPNGCPQQQTTNVRRIFRRW